MRSRPLVLSATFLALALAPAAARAEPATPPPADPQHQTPATVSARSEYERGVRARLAEDWPGAAAAFLRAVTADTAFPEAWNELGFALRHQGRYTESLAAYDEALRLRPDFPEALEYLGEAYVKLGRMDDARRILDRLRVLDPPRAAELAEEIAKAR